jgi:CTP:molybdopterin cytidylyltransferase MocA
MSLQPSARPRGTESRGLVHVVVLAAGEGRRLGLGPKAHVTLGDETFLSRVLRSCRDADVGPVHVVGSPRDARIEAACARLGARLTLNPAPERGMSSSVNLGLAAAQEEGPAGGVLVFPVDVPLVEARTLRLLGGALALGPDVWARPVFRGTSGHPVALGSGVIPALLSMGATVPLRDALRLLDARRVDVDCDDAGVITDIDLPEQLAAARAAVP